MKVQKNLFVIGCPRSGTTALGKLLNTHPAICLGVERYTLLSFPKHFRLNPSLFTYERFFDLQPGDTFYSDMEAFFPEYANLRDKYIDSIYVGDKIPILYKAVDKLVENFPGAKIILITRNIFHVAASYLRRARDETDSTWQRTRGLQAAVEDWARAIEVLDRIRHRKNVIPVCYELFFDDDAPLRRVCDTLDITCDDAFLASFRNFQARFRQLESHSSLDLTAAEILEIVATAPIDQHRKLLREVWDYQAPVAA